MKVIADGLETLAIFATVIGSLAAISIIAAVLAFDSLKSRKRSKRRRVGT